METFSCLHSSANLQGFQDKGRAAEGKCRARARRGSVSSAVHPRRASRPRSRRDAQETAGGGFRGSIQAPQPRGNGNERGGAFVRFLHPDPVSPDPVSPDQSKWQRERFVRILHPDPVSIDAHSYRSLHSITFLWDLESQ